MGLPQVERFCFIIDLKTGSIVLGIISAIVSFILFIIMIVNSVEISTLKFESTIIEQIVTNSDTIEMDAKVSGLYAMTIILTLMFLAKCLFDAFFIYGVLMERSKFIKAYYIIWAVFTLLSMFVFFLNTYYYGMGTIITEVTSLVINVYLILVSNSFYVQLNSTQEVA